MGFRFKAIKILIILPNLLIFVLGCIMIGYSASIISNKAKDYEVVDELNGKVKIGAVLFLNGGIFACFVSFLGFCGVIVNNRKMIMTYIFITSLIFLFEVIGAVLVFQGKEILKQKVYETLHRNLISYDQVNSNELILVQQHFGCCGVKSALDWASADNWDCWNKTRSKNPVPVSCCGSKDTFDNCNMNCWVENHQIYQSSNNTIDSFNGCFDALEDMFPTIGGLAIAMICLHLV